MPSITLKDVPEDVHAALKAQAAAHGRSLNREVILRLRLSVVKDRATNRKAVIEKARELQRRMKGNLVDDAFLSAARREGRP